MEFAIARPKPVLADVLICLVTDQKKVFSFSLNSLLSCSLISDKTVISLSYLCSFFAINAVLLRARFSFWSSSVRMFQNPIVSYCPFLPISEFKNPICLSQSCFFFSNEPFINVITRP